MKSEEFAKESDFAATISSTISPEGIESDFFHGLKENRLLCHTKVCMHVHVSRDPPAEIRGWDKSPQVVFVSFTGSM